MGDPSPRGLGVLLGVAVVQAALIALLANALLRGEAAASPTLDTAAGIRMDPEAPAPEPGVPISEAAGPPAGSTGETANNAPSPPTAAPRRAVLFGRVQTGDSQLRDGWLRLYQGDASKELTLVSLRREVSDYAFPGLEPGRYRLRLRASGFREVDDEFEIPAGVDRVRRDVTLHKSWELRVQILTPEGRPVHERIAELAKESRGLWNLEVAAIATPDPPPAVFPPTDLREPEFGSGRWMGGMMRGMGEGVSLPKRFAGYLELAEDRPMFVSAVLRTAVLATERVEPGQEEVTLTVPFDRVVGSTGTVRLQVVDGATGKPVPDARVGLSDAQSGGGGMQVDAEGRIELRYLRPGRLNVDVTAKDRVGPSVDVEIVPGAVMDLGALPTFEPFLLKLRLEGMTPGEGTPSVQLTALEPPPHPALRNRAVGAYSHGDGSLEARLAPGRYLLRASRRGSAVLEFDTRTLGAEPLVVRLQPEAKLRITPPAGRKVELLLRDTAGRTVFRRWLTWTAAFDVPLPPGDYAAEITGLDGSAERRAVPLPAGGAELDLR